MEVAIYGGFPLGFGLGVAVYGGIGWLVAGQTGFAIGAAIAAGFAIAGLIVTLRFRRSLIVFLEDNQARMARIAADEVPF